MKYVTKDQSYCPECGKPIAQAKFCSECGAAGRGTALNQTGQRMKASTGFIIFLAFCLFILVASRVLNGPVDNKPSAETQATPAPAPVKSPKQIQAGRTRFAKLQKDFVITTDEFTGIKTYRHKVFSPYMNGNGTAIEAEIQAKDKSKALYVTSEFVSDDWIFHEAYEVKTKKTGPMVFSGSTRREVLDGKICEVVSSTNESSELIAGLISVAQESHEPIRVRLDGKFRYDYTLQPTFERAIAETYELYGLMDRD